MRHEIILAPEAVDDLRALKANLWAIVQDAIEKYLRYEPAKVSKSRIKHLRGLSHPQYRLRVDEVRIFYDIIDETVGILAIVPKSEADAWLEKAGEADETSGAL